MPTKIKTQNLLSWVISDAIPSSWDFTVTLSQAPTYTKGFIVFNVTSSSNYESVYFHNRIWNVIYVKAENRASPKAHSIGTTFQMNNTAELINYLSDNADTFWYVEKTGWLTVNVWGGYVLTETWRVLVNDTSLTLPNGQTNYIYLTTSNTITSTLDLWTANSGVILATVITGSTSVSTITQDKPYVMQKAWPQWEQGIQGIQWEQGIQGIQGIQWPVWPQWEQGIQGIQWEQGIQGIQGIEWPAWAWIPTGGTTGQILQKTSWVDYETSWLTLTGGWDMVKATYDPTNKNQDVFAYPYSKAEADALLATKQPTIGYATANDSAVVHNTWNENIYWEKTFFQNFNLKWILFCWDTTPITWLFFSLWRPNSTTNQIDSYTHWVWFRDLILNWNQLFLKADGNVGIWNTTPTEKLDVNGNIKIDWHIKQISTNRYIENKFQVKNASDDGWVNFNTYIDADDGAGTWIKSYSIWGYPKKSDGTITGFERFIRFWFDSFDNITWAYLKVAEIYAHVIKLNWTVEAQNNVKVGWVLMADWKVIQTKKSDGWDIILYKDVSWSPNNDFHFLPDVQKHSSTDNRVLFWFGSAISSYNFLSNWSWTNKELFWINWWTWKIRYIWDWSQWAGKVLTSDADWYATWETPTAWTQIWASVYSSTSFNIPETLTVVPLDLENFDTSNFHNNSTNNSRLTVPTTWVYTVWIHCSIFTSVSWTYEAYALIRKNWTTWLAWQKITPSWSWSGWYSNLSFSTSVQLNAWDYIEVMFSKSSWTPTMSIQNTAADFSFFIKS